MGNKYGEKYDVRIRLAEVLAVCLFLVTLVCAGQGAEMQVGGGKSDSYDWIYLYCDVDFWNPSEWSVEKNTITGDITQKTGIALRVDVPERDADRRLSLMLLNDELPDIISVTDPTVIHQLVTSGKVWNLQEFLSAYCPNSHLLTEFPEDIRQELIKRDGAWYAYPSHMQSADAYKIWTPNSSFYEDYIQYNHNYVIIWNKSLLKRLGIEESELHTQSQVIAALKKAKESDLMVRGKPIIPLLMDGAGYQETALAFLMNSFGAEPLDSEGNYRDPLRAPETKRALEFMQTVLSTGYCPVETLSYTGEKVNKCMAEGRTLCFIGNVANITYVGNEWVSSGAVLSADGSSPVLGKNLHANQGWISTFVSKNCSNPEKVATWLDYMTSDEGMRLWGYGYEGEHFSYDRQGLIARTSEQQSMESQYTQTGIGTWWMFVNTAWVYSALKEPEQGSNERMKMELQMAYGKDEATVLYDNMPFDFSGELYAESALGERENQLFLWTDGQLRKVILASDAEEFEREYLLLMRGMEERGIAIIDGKKNGFFKENCKRLSITPEKINQD